MADPKFQPIDRSCVVRGSLNPGIITPDWMRRQKLLAEGKTHLEFRRGGVPSLSFRDDRFGWECTAESLVVRSVSDDAIPGEALARLLEILVHTPVVAVGNNCAFRIAGGAAPRDEECAPWLAKKLDAAGGDTQQAVILAKNDARLQVRLFCKDGAAQRVDFNFHRPTRDTTDARDAAEQWRADFDAAIQMMEELLA